MELSDNKAEVREARAKKEYQRPKLERFGDMKQITLGGGAGLIDNRNWRADLS